MVWSQVESGKFQEIQQKYYSVEDVANEYDANDQVQVAVVKHSTAAEMNDDAVSSSSLRKSKPWKFPENFEFTWASPAVVFS